MGLIEGRPVLGFTVTDKAAFVSEMRLLSQFHRSMAARLDRFIEIYEKEK